MDLASGAGIVVKWSECDGVSSDVSMLEVVDKTAMVAVERMTAVSTQSS